MSPLIILGLSITLLVLVSICVALMVSWRNKNKLHKQLEQLLEDINEQQTSRKKLLTVQLSNKFKLSKNDCDQVSEQLVEAEKKFLQYYVGQAIQQIPSNTLYAELTELLDLYLNNLSKQLPSEESKPAELPISAEGNDDSGTRIEPSANSEATPSQKPEPEPEPDWGDVFD